MSKVVKGVGRAVGKVVKGVTNVVKKVAKSKLGKVLIGAALVYFGGAALMGGFSGAAAGGGLSGALSGAAQGVANAWTSLTGAASSALGGNFAQAGSQLSAGIQGTTTAAQGVVGGGLTVPTVGSTTGAVGGGGLTVPTAGSTTGAVGGSTLTATTPSYSLIGGTGNAAGGLSTAGVNIAPGVGAGAGAAKPGILSSLMSNKYVAPTLIQGGFQLGGAALAKKEAEDADEATRGRYNANIAGFQY